MKCHAQIGLKALNELIVIGYSLLEYTGSAIIDFHN